MMSEQIKKLVHDLRLFGIHGNFSKRCEEASSKALSYAEFLRLVLEDEDKARKEASAKKVMSKAKFRFAADLEDWDESFERGITKQKLRELGSLSFSNNVENLTLVGGTGAGKTHLAVALGRRLCADNITTMFLPVNFLFEEIQAARVAGKYLSYIKKITQTKVIILDDFGLRSYTHEEATALVDLLEDRHRKGSVIITSQANPKGWAKLFEDPLIAEAIVNRLEHPGHLVHITGSSYRDRLQSLPLGKKKLVPARVLN
jgi:DNA replication protein DnaC